MEKSFQEVIATIKEGEVWLSDASPISFIRLRANGALDFNKNMGVNLNCKYKLQRKECTFEEAFKAYETGKEIESNEYRYKKINNEDAYFDNRIAEWRRTKYLSIELKEIRDKWYIND